MSVTHGDHAHGGGHEHAHGHEHSPYLEHHFETLGQQFESDKFGMWLFLATEVLLFGGLFCAYSVYRGNHPEIFIYAHQYLNKMWGGINTVVLLFSSFTIAWAVRATQLGQRKIQITMLVLTLICAFGFLGIKYVEYSEKWAHGLLPGVHYSPHVEGHGDEHSTGHSPATGADPHAAEGTGGQPAAGIFEEAPGDSGDSGLHAAADSHAASSPAAVPADALHGETARAETALEKAEAADPGQVLAQSPAAEAAATPAADPNALEPSKIAMAAAPPGGLAKAEQHSHGAHGMSSEPKNVQTFFAVYFVMTGLHGVHVLAGIVAIFIILFYAIKGIYKPEWYTPVDMVALYWHIVDLVWIFLFPLLYLIH